MHDVDPLLDQVSHWSQEVDENIARIVRNVSPFSYVQETLSSLQGKADMIVVSATPHEAIVREWTENRIAQYVNLIAGQELGTKEDVIRTAMSGRYSAVEITRQLKLTR